MSGAVLGNANVRRLLFDMRWYEYLSSITAFFGVFMFDTMQLGEPLFRSSYLPAGLVYLVLLVALRSHVKAKQWPRLPVTRREMGLALWGVTVFLPSALIILAMLLALMAGLMSGRMMPRALAAGVSIMGWQIAVIGLPRLIWHMGSSVILGLWKQAKFPLGGGTRTSLALFGLVSSIAGFVAAVCGFIAFAARNPQPRPFLLAIGLAGVASVVWHYRVAGRRLPGDLSRSPMLDPPPGEAPETGAADPQRLGWAAMIPVCRMWVLTGLKVGAFFYALCWGFCLVAAAAGSAWDDRMTRAMFGSLLMVVAPLSGSGMGWASVYGARVLAGLPLKAGTTACLLVSHAVALTATIMLPPVLFDLAVNRTHPALSLIALLPPLGLGAVGVGAQIRGLPLIYLWVVLAMLMVFFSLGDPSRFPDLWTILASAAAIFLGWVWVYWELTNGRCAYRARPVAFKGLLKH